MKNKFRWIAGLIAILIIVSNTRTASAQLPVKIKIPKVSQPQPTPTETSQPAPADTQPTQPPPERSKSGPASGGPYARQPAPPATPMLLAETLELKTETWDYYWKAPGQSNYTSWLPRVHFYVKYRGPARLRFKADYTMPDGQPWFSEMLEQKGGDEELSTFQLDSPYATDDDKKTVAVPGLFGVKVTNIKDNSVVFQGKFKVIKFKPANTDERYKNLVDFYIDHDLLLPIGHTDVVYNGDYAYPYVCMWFKGGINATDLEARLFYNGKALATTDEGGNVGVVERRSSKHAANDPALNWTLYRFSWPKKIIFIVTDAARNHVSNRNRLYINQMPGEYIVKIFYQGEQIRETKFSIAEGNFADNGLATKNGISTDKILLPIKVLGNADKWNAATARLAGFYGNPLTGFSEP
jgi:hypothetical protein